MRRLILLALVAAGCGPQFAVIPKGGAPTAQAQAPMGISLVALADQWADDPYDLADYVTPIAVELSNPGPYDVRVSLADFALRDEAGVRYQAVSPFVPSALGVLELGDPRQMVASRGGSGARFGASVRSGGGYRGGVSVGAPSGRRYGSWGYSGGGGRFTGGFYVSGGLRGWYGPGAAYWRGPFFTPPWYSTWVIGWGPGFYPSGRPSYDVLRSALPEGVLPANSRVTGFLYFKKATAPGKRSLDLAWSLVDARSNADLGSLHVPLDIVAR
jgi:hypothetical protein